MTWPAAQRAFCLFALDRRADRAVAHAVAVTDDHGRPPEHHSTEMKMIFNISFDPSAGSFPAGDTRRAEGL